MALNNFKCNHLMPLYFKGLKSNPTRYRRDEHWLTRRQDNRLLGQCSAKKQKKQKQTPPSMLDQA